MIPDISELLVRIPHDTFDVTIIVGYVSFLRPGSC